MNLSLLFLLTYFWTIGIASIRVQLIVPKLVREGSSPTLICRYSIDKKPLYSVKWYRGQYEFYRYVPLAEPQFAAFPLGGIDIDMSRSNATQVTLKNVPKYISGVITCEVSIDGTFKTATDSANLTITDVHIRKPYLNVSSNKLFPIEDLRITCSAEVTDPPPLINFYIDNVKVSRFMVQNLGNGQAMLNSSVLLAFVELNRNHISPVWLRCDGYVGGAYHLSSASIPIIPQLPTDQASFSGKSNVNYYVLLFIALKNIEFHYL